MKKEIKRNGLKKIVMVACMAFVLALTPFVLSASEHQHTLELKDMTFSWSIEEEKIHVTMSAKTTGWVAVGFDPEVAMSGANIIIGAVKKGKFKVEDHYGDRKRGHSKDEKLGGKDDILASSGTEEDGVTTISFTFPLQSDDKYDKPINPDETTRMMFAYGAGKDSFKSRHPYRAIYDINLTSGESKKIK